MILTKFSLIWNYVHILRFLEEFVFELLLYKWLNLKINTYI